MESLSAQQLEDYKAAFELFDRDMDGTITSKEMATALRHLGQNPTEAELQELLAELDQDGNGTIEFEELMALIVKNEGNAQQDIDTEIKEIFNLLDRDNSGFISIQDLKAVAISSGMKLSETEIENMIIEADNDGDGQISLEEFIEIVKPALVGGGEAEGDDDINDEDIVERPVRS
ncbi:translation elongation factor EF1B gamma [Terramyces sp. JEL0728]|nr:translation elongation factor EF1B gamma [Terramyces sp. JEL0728]